MPANAVSLIGLAFGVGAAIAYAHWDSPLAALVGFLLSICWLIADGLDGKIARATNTASAFGRFLDGICDHLIFVLIYLALALSIGTVTAWVLAVVAGVAHAVQSTLYEGERYRFHRRLRGDALLVRPAPSSNPLVRLYDAVAGSIDRVALRFERALGDSAQPARFGADYGRRAAPALRFAALLSANTRVLAIFIACLLGRPTLFWWFEIVPLTAVAAIGLVWHRRIETSFTAHLAPPTGDRPTLTA